MSVLLMSAPPLHVCAGDCHPDAYCACCLAECDCADLAEGADAGGPTPLPMRPVREWPGAREWERILARRAAARVALHHPEDARPTDPLWIRRHGQAAGGVERRDARDEGVEDA